MMKAIALALTIVLAGGAAHAASITNTDGQPHSLQITEGGVKSEIVIGAGETVSACTGGCFLTMPNGDREALSGSEAVDIVGGKVVIK